MEEKCCWGHVSSFQQSDKQQIPAGCYSLPIICSEKEELHTALSFNRMADSKRKKELIPLSLIKDDKVISWLNSDPTLNNVVDRISDNIVESAKGFETNITQVSMSEAHKDNSLEEIEIEIKVPEEMDMYELNDFWDDVGDKVDLILEKEASINHTKAQEIKERLLIVVIK